MSDCRGTSSLISDIITTQAAFGMVEEVMVALGVTAPAKGPHHRPEQDLFLFVFVAAKIENGTPRPKFVVWWRRGTKLTNSRNSSHYLFPPLCLCSDLTFEWGSPFFTTVVSTQAPLHPQSIHRRIHCRTRRNTLGRRAHTIPRFGDWCLVRSSARKVKPVRELGPATKTRTERTNRHNKPTQ